MKLSKIAEINDLKRLTPEIKELEEQEIKDLMVTDLMSHAMSLGKKGMLFVTIQAHKNVLAVALLKEFSAILVPYNVEVPEILIKEAAIRDMPIYSSPESTYHLIGQMYQQINIS